VKRAVHVRFDLQEPLTRESLVSRIHPENEPRWRQLFSRPGLLNGHLKFSIESYRLRQTTLVMMRGRFLWDEHGNVLEIIGVTIDLTAQKQSDLELQVHGRNSRT